LRQSDERAVNVSRDFRIRFVERLEEGGSFLVVNIQGAGPGQAGVRHVHVGRLEM
jgi:hypothetical protein